MDTSSERSSLKPENGPFGCTIAQHAAWRTVCAWPLVGIYHKWTYLHTHSNALMQHAVDPLGRSLRTLCRSQKDRHVGCRQGLLVTTNCEHATCNQAICSKDLFATIGWLVARIACWFLSPLVAFGVMNWQWTKWLFNILRCIERTIKELNQSRTYKSLMTLWPMTFSFDVRFGWTDESGSGIFLKIELASQMLSTKELLRVRYSNFSWLHHLHPRLFLSGSRSCSCHYCSRCL